VPKIRPDNVGIGHLGAEHFMERGHRHFGFCGFSNEGWARERRDGFVEALELAGHTCDVFEANYPGDLTPYWDEEQISSIAGWLKHLPKPVGVMASMDMQALQVMSAAHAAGLLVPEEVALLGANNDTIRCELCYPALSSVAVNAFQSGYQAADTLATLMAGKPPEAMDRRIEPVEVVTRPSTDLLAIEDRSVATALAYIRAQACQGVTVDAVSQHAFASRSQLEKKFRRYLGRSPQAEIRRVQVAKIRQLLADTDFPLKRIAEIAGFEHVEYMSVVFKRLMRLTPGGYRERVQTKPMPG
jgi:LacI family transcriptional regulator